MDGGMSLVKFLNYVHFFTSLALLFVFYFVVTDIYKDKDTKDRGTHVHTTIYVDRNFNDVEQEYIIEAAMEWTQATNHVAEFDVVQLPTREKIDVEHALIMIKVSADYPDIMIMDNIKKTTTLGYYDGKNALPYIALVSDRLDGFNYKEVVLHELGHSLGLEHVDGEEGMLTLMYPYVDLGSDVITDKDLEQFCKLYHCDVKKLKH
jgi:hypothetical protein